MHIDAHQHFWRYNPREYGWIDDSMASLRRDFLPSDLEPELQSNGFEGCVAVQVRQSLEETRWLLELADAASFIVGVVGWVDLTSPQLRSELERIATSSKLVGVRHIVQSEPDDRSLMDRDKYARRLVRETGQYFVGPSRAEMIEDEVPNRGDLKWQRAADHDSMRPHGFQFRFCL